MDNANSLEKLLPGIISFLRSLSKSGLSDIEQCKLRRFISIIDSWHPPPLPSRNVEALPKINRIKDHAVEDCMSDELYCPVDTESNREDEPESFYVDPDDPDGLSMEVVESDEEESFDPVERDPMYNNLSSPQLPRTASATAATIADCLHRGWVSMKGMMTWNRRYLILVLKSGNVEPPCALLQAYKRDTHKRHVWSIEVNHYDISYQEKDSRPMMKISRQGHESHFIGVDIASLTHWFKVLSTFSKSCQMPPDETSSTNSSNSGQMTIANSEANGDVTTKNAKDTSKSKLQNITTWINRGNKKKTSVADLHLEMSPQFSVAGYVNISYDGKKNYQRRLCAINSESGLLSCYVDNSMSEVERSIPLAGLDLDFCKDKKRPLAIAVYTKGDSRREVVTIEPLDKLSQGNWLEALAKETTVGSHQNGNQEDPNMPSFPAPARPDTAPNLSVDALRDSQQFVEATSTNEQHISEDHGDVCVSDIQDDAKDEACDAYLDMGLSPNVGRGSYSRQESDTYAFVPEDDASHTRLHTADSTAAAQRSHTSSDVDVVNLSDATTSASHTDDDVLYENEHFSISQKSNKLLDSFIGKMNTAFNINKSSKKGKSSMSASAEEQQTESGQQENMGLDVDINRNQAKSNLAMLQRELPPCPVPDDLGESGIVHPSCFPEDNSIEENYSALTGESYQSASASNEYEQDLSNLSEIEDDNECLYDDVMDLIPADKLAMLRNKPAVPQKPPQLCKSEPHKSTQLGEATSTTTEGATVLLPTAQSMGVTAIAHNTMDTSTRTVTSNNVTCITATSSPLPISEQNICHSVPQAHDTTADLIGNDGNFQLSAGAVGYRKEPSIAVRPVGEGRDKVQVSDSKKFELSAGRVSDGRELYTPPSSDPEWSDDASAYEEPVDLSFSDSTTEKVKCHEGPTIDLDRDVLQNSQNPILQQIREERRSSLSSHRNLSPSLSFRSGSPPLSLSSASSTSLSPAEIKQQIIDLEAELDEATKKSSEVRAKKNLCQSVTKKREYEEMQRECTRERMRIRDQLAELRLKQISQPRGAASSNNSSTNSSPSTTRSSSRGIQRTVSDGARFHSSYARSSLATSPRHKTTTISNTTSVSTHRKYGTTTTSTTTRSSEAVDGSSTTSLSKTVQYWESLSK